MSDTEFDTALIAAAFRLAAEDGWRHVTVPAACRAAGLPLSEARARFPGRSTILLRFGRLADQAALTDAPSEGPVRDRLFDLLMRRFDALQTHRDGIKALLRALPTDPATTLLLAVATRDSMRWMLQAAGIDATGPRGDLQAQGLAAVWLWCLRTWEKDETDDLSGTMSALDSALGRAEQVASWMGGGTSSAPPPPPMAEGAGELDPSDPAFPDPDPPGPPAGTPPAPLDPTPMIEPPDEPDA
ncbi:TetR family transcriptional regulator [Rhodopila sp.]|uniref:TetR family transcriptional regulator n=1 Tax=Rhodopila sp. TaxID=2480087 RepID=UPI003D1317D6